MRSHFVKFYVEFWNSIILTKMFHLFDFSFIYFLSSKNHYRLVLAFLFDRYLLIIYTNSKDAIKCMLNDNQDAEEFTQRCSWEKVFWKYAANLQENTHAEVWFQ